RGPGGQEGGEHHVEVEGKDVLDVGVRSRARAQRLPQRAGGGVAAGGEEEVEAGAAQMLLEQVEPERPGLGRGAITARTQSEKPPIARPEAAGARPETARDTARSA